MALGDKRNTGEAASDDTRNRFQEPALIVVLAFIEPERLFVQVAGKVFGIHADIIKLNRGSL